MRVRGRREVKEGEIRGEKDAGGDGERSTRKKREKDEPS